MKLQIWDTAGQERFRSITQSYYRSAHSLILVYDISSQPSFDSLPQWCRDIEQFAGNSNNITNSKVVSSNCNTPSTKGSPSLVDNGLLKVLVGNKCDKEREIPEYVARSFAENNSFHIFMETSALDSENVEKLFHQIASVLVERSSNASSISANNCNSNNSVPLRNSSWTSNSSGKPNCVSCSFSF